MTPFYEKKREDLIIWEANNIDFPAHFHDNLELFFCLDSGLTVMAGGETRTLNAGDLVLLFPNIVHSYLDAGETGDLLRANLIICPLELIGDFYRTLSDYQPESPFVSAASLHTDAIYALRALSAPQAKRNPLADRALIQLILAQTLPLLRLRKKAAAPTLLHRVVERLSDHYREPLTLELLADSLGVSRSHLSRLFSDQLQCGFNDYLNRLRLTDAQNLLGASDLSITQICYECGFDSQRTFNRAFQKLCGTTPRAYRIRQRGEEDGG